MSGGGSGRTWQLLCLAVDEQVVLESTGGFKDSVRPVWKLGHLYLTNQRLFLLVPTGILFETSLSDVTKVTVEKQRYIAGRIKDTIAITRKTFGGRVAQVWIITPGLETWRRNIYQRTLLEITPEALDGMKEQLDPPCWEIVCYIWENKHARIDELAELIAAPSHMDVLLKIREVINPTAERIIGGHILTFERAKIDPETRKNVVFSWWFAPSARVADVARSPALLDVFDEGDDIDVVSDLAGAREEVIDFQLAREKVVVFAGGLKREYRYVATLPGKADPDSSMNTYTNNILVLDLQKQRPFVSRKGKEQRS